MIDRANIGRSLPVLTVDVEKGQLRFFAKATGETNPIYFDEDAARAAGHPGLPAPPTFAFSLSLAAPDPFAWLTNLGVDLGRVLHGEQRFDYTGALIYASDRITLEPRITDIYEKKDGALVFIVTETRLRNQRGDDMGTMSLRTVVRKA